MNFLRLLKQWILIISTSAGFHRGSVFAGTLHCITIYATDKKAMFVA